MDEHAQIGAKALAEFLSIPLDSVKHNLIPGMKELGVVFEWPLGRPAKTRLLWFPSEVKRYMAAVQRDKNAEKKKDHPEKK
jgi:hypothetical protein